MAGPGDPEEPKSPQEPTSGHDPDDLVGFASPAHLTGRPRTPEPEPDPEPEPEHDPLPTLEPEPPEIAPEPEPEPDPVVVEAPEPAPVVAPVVAPAAASVIPARPAAEPMARRDRERERSASPAAPPAVPMGLYAVYALILFAVPTLGASALLALLAVTGREGPREPLAASHFIFQQRTLWTGAVVALLGLILIVVNVGVFVLFVVAVWLMARGAWGVLRLKSGQPIPNPRGWLF